MPASISFSPDSTLIGKCSASANGAAVSCDLIIVEV
jgi:hypothetical protein